MTRTSSTPRLNILLKASIIRKGYTAEFVVSTTLGNQFQCFTTPMGFFFPQVPSTFSILLVSVAHHPSAV